MTRTGERCVNAETWRGENELGWARTVPAASCPSLPAAPPTASTAQATFESLDVASDLLRIQRGVYRLRGSLQGYKMSWMYGEKDGRRTSARIVFGRAGFHRNLLAGGSEARTSVLHLRSVRVASTHRDWKRTFSSNPRSTLSNTRSHDSKILAKFHDVSP